VRRKINGCIRYQRRISRTFKFIQSAEPLPGSSGLSDNKGANKGAAALNASGETGSNNPTDLATRGSSDYGDGGDGYGGGGSSDRDPAGDRYKGQGMFGSKNAAAKDSAATDPLLPITADLFQRISNVAKTQCIRELVLCNQK
jgi:hypothetical protein